MFLAMTLTLSIKQTLIQQIFTMNLAVIMKLLNSDAYKQRDAFIFPTFDVAILIFNFWICEASRHSFIRVEFVPGLMMNKQIKQFHLNLNSTMF